MIMAGERGHFPERRAQHEASANKRWQLYITFGRNTVFRHFGENSLPNVNCHFQAALETASPRDILRPRDSIY